MAASGTVSATVLSSIRILVTSISASIGCAIQQAMPREFGGNGEWKCFNRNGVS